MRATLALAFLLGIPLAGQAPFPPGPASGGRLGQQYPDSSGPYEQNSPEAKRLQAINAQRQKTLVSDTEKLLKLARELNDEVTAGDSPGSSEDQMRKVNEIGKLAKSIKEKMSYSAGGYPGLPAPLTTAPPIQ